ncbi:hypothetical protein PUN28_010779 [Cardiocondyla obscurior]|uniref:Uncharacterized protein n=1 Tax=Cardiocondyla obscurior TaxID=286306 RepID=A0AAW2FHR6_9HYME
MPILIFSFLCYSHQQIISTPLKLMQIGKSHDFFFHNFDSALRGFPVRHLRDDNEETANNVISKRPDNLPLPYKKPITNGD